MFIINVCHIYKKQLLDYIELKNAPLDKGYNFGIPNDINILRYRLTEYTISQIDITSQSIIRLCIDKIMEYNKKITTSRVYLTSQFDIEFLLYELYNAQIIEYIKCPIKLISEKKNQFFESIDEKYDNYMHDKNTIYITENTNLYFEENIKIILISKDNVYIRL